MAVADREVPRLATAGHCGRDPMRVVWRTRRTATLAGLLVGAPQQSPSANRRLQKFQQRPFSELDYRTVDTLRDRSQGRADRGVRSAQLQQPLCDLKHILAGYKAFLGRFAEIYLA